MNIELLVWSKKRQVMHFLLKQSTDAFANLIRRYIMDEIPTLAIEDVEFKENSSALYDEIIAHRLGLMPITTDLKGYVLREQCSCKGEGCATCQLVITLKSSKKGIVTAGEAKSSDSGCTFVFGGMPVVELIARQKIELAATAVLGKGKDHAKWAPALAYYRKEPSIKVEKALSEEQKRRIALTCDDTVAVNGKVKVDMEKLRTSARFDACVGALEDAGAIVTETGNHLFTVESWGQLDCKTILEQAADAVLRSLDEVEQQLPS